MSGGSWDYFCYKLGENADRLCHDKDTHRKAFGKHLKLCADAMHDIEWVDSCDMGHGDEYKAIDVALGKGAKSLILKEIKDEAESIMGKLKELLNDTPTDN